jgi:hypothetical protein
MKRTESQIEQVEKWLLKGLKITPIQALEKFGCFRLGAIIWILNKFYNGCIKSKLVKVPTRHGRGYAWVAQYWLEE